jgi:hypothetical protein
MTARRNSDPVHQQAAYRPRPGVVIPLPALGQSDTRAPLHTTLRIRGIVSGLAPYPAARTPCYVCIDPTAVQTRQPRVFGVLDPWSPCFQSLCVRFPCVADGDLRALADRRRRTARVGLRRSRAAGRPGAAVACPSRSCSPRFRTPAARLAKRGKPGWRGGQRRGRGLGVRRPDQVTDNTVTVRDSKRFAEPLALPRSCPLYVRKQWIRRTYDPILWWSASSARTCIPYRHGGMFSQVSTA